MEEVQVSLVVKPESGVFPDTDKAKHLVASEGGFREADGHHLCWGTHLATQEQEHRRLSQARERRGRGDQRREGCSGPPAKGMRPFTLETLVGFSAAPVLHLDCLFLLVLVLCTVRKQHWPGGTGWVVDPGHSLDSQQLEAKAGRGGKC